MKDEDFASLLPDDLVDAVARDHASKGWASLTAEGLASTRNMLVSYIRNYPPSAANKWWYTRVVVSAEKELAIPRNAQMEVVHDELVLGRWWKELKILHKAHREEWSRSEARQQLRLASIQVAKDRLGRLKRRLARLENATGKRIDRQGKMLARVASRLELAVAQQIGRRRRRMDRIEECLKTWATKWYDDAAKTTLAGWADLMPDVAFSLTLDDNDMTLAEKWINKRNSYSEDDYMRVHAARRAEKSAFAYYHKALGLDVQDVAITQLSGGLDWQKCDLKVLGRPIDVKNVRGGSWGGWLLPTKPKRDAQDREVVICGVTTCDKGKSTQTVTGEVTRQQMIEVTNAAQQVPRWSFSKWEHQRLAQWKSGMGAWLMEYPPQHYKHWKCELFHMTPTAQELERYLGPPPKWLKALMAWRTGKLLGSTDDVLTNDLADWGRRAPRTRPALFVFVLLHLLSEAHEQRWSSNETKEHVLGSLFLPSDVHRIYPLGLHDPLSTLDAAVNLIDQVIERNYKLVVQAAEFKLQGARVLRGRRPNGRWFTLLAYCGRCGHSPLRAGDLVAAWKGGEGHPRGNDDTGYHRATAYKIIVPSIRYLGSHRSTPPGYASS